MQVCEVPFTLPGDMCYITCQLSLAITDSSFAENAAPLNCICVFHV